jgi:CRISPR-associated protein Cas1
MKLILNTPGLYLCKRGECFQIQSENEKQEIAAVKVDQIMIATHAAITTDAIELALENNIDIIFLKNTGQPMGRVWHSKLGSITTIRRKQLFLQDSSFGLQLVKEWLAEKIDNKIRVLNKLAVNRRDEERRELIKEAIQSAFANFYLTQTPLIVPLTNDTNLCNNVYMRCFLSIFFL